MLIGLVGLVAAGGTALTQTPASRTARQSPGEPPVALVDTYCSSCHDEFEKKGDLALDMVARQDIARHPEVWEKVVRKLRARQMPPVGKERPDDATYDAVIAFLETALDRAAAAHPNPGRTATLRRLTRTEYQNAIRDLLALEIDVDVAAARGRVELWLRQRHGRRPLADAARSLPLRGGENQSHRRRSPHPHRPAATRSGCPPTSRRSSISTGLPIGTRGGAVVRYTFPMDGEYEIQIRLMRDRDEHVEGLTEAHELELLVDKARVAAVHGETAATRAGTRDDRPASQDSRPGAGRPARARRRVPEESRRCCRKPRASRIRRTSTTTAIRAFSRRSTPSPSSAPTARPSRATRRAGAGCCDAAGGPGSGGGRGAADSRHG